MMGANYSPLGDTEVSMRLRDRTALVTGGGAAVAMDVTGRASVARGVESLAARWGAIDILVNNAGVSGITALTDSDDALWQRIIATNLTGMYLVIKAVAPRMQERARGRIVNLSSVLGRFGVPGYAAYCSS